MAQPPADPLIVVSRGGNGMGWVGSCIAAVCLYLAWRLWSDPASVTVDHRPGTRADLWLPLLVAAGGVALAGLRWSTAVDVRTGRVDRRRSWFGWAWSGTRELGALQRVELTQEVRGTGKHRRVVRPVVLVGSAGSLELGDYQTPAAARQQAESAARAAGLPLHDHAGGTLVVRQPGELDTPLAMRLGPADFDLPPATAGSRLVVEDVPGHGVAVRIRAPALVRLAAPVAAAVLAGVPLLVWWTVLRQHPAGLLLLVPALLGPLLAITVLRRSGALGGLLRVDDDGLAWCGAAIPAGELEELAVMAGPPRHLRAASDRRELRIGAGLDQADLERLRALACLALAGRRAPG